MDDELGLLLMMMTSSSQLVALSLLLLSPHCRSEGTSYAAVDLAVRTVNRRVYRVSA